MRNGRYNSGMTTTRTLIANLNTLRTSGAVTVNELAEKSGLHRVTVSNILNGHQDTITLETACSLAEAVGMSLDTLIGGPLAVQKS